MTHSPLAEWALPVLHRLPQCSRATEIVAVRVDTCEQYGGDERYLGSEVELIITWADADGVQESWIVRAGDAVALLNDLLKRIK